MGNNNIAQLSDRQRHFLQQRRRLHQLWPYVGSAMVLVWIVFGIIIYVRVPLLANPGYMLQQIQAETLDRNTILLAAFFCPVLMGMIFGLILVVLGLGFAVFRLEGRYLAIVQQLQPNDSDPRS